MATTWKKKLTHKSKVYVEHQVGDHMLRFYPNRMGMSTELADISKPIMHALATLFSESRGDSASVHETFRQKVKKDKAGNESADETIDKITVEAVSPEIADHRKKERDTAIDEMIDGLTSPRNRLQFGKLLMDSLRDEFDYTEERATADVEEFLYGIPGDAEEYEGLDIPMLVQLTQGWLKANAKVFGDVGEKLTGLVKGKLGALQGHLPSGVTTSTDAGSSSKTPSSAPSDSDSPSES